MTSPTWVRNPQDPEDEHDWSEWFCPANDYRGLVWSDTEEKWIPQSPS